MQFKNPTKKDVFQFLQIFITNLKKNRKLECGPMPNVMAALPNIGGALFQRRKVWLTPTTRVPCSNAAKTKPVEITWGAPN